MRNLNYTLEEVDKPFLNEKELSAIMKKELAIPRIVQVRDIFVFCCFTGLAFIDVKNLTSNDIVEGMGGVSGLKSSDISQSNGLISLSCLSQSR
jgi:hypothetical protein